MQILIGAKKIIGSTVLIIACKYGSVEMVSLLLENGAADSLYAK